MNNNVFDFLIINNQTCRFVKKRLKQEKQLLLLHYVNRDVYRIMILLIIYKIK